MTTPLVTFTATAYGIEIHGEGDTLGWRMTDESREALAGLDALQLRRARMRARRAWERALWTRNA